MELALFYFLIGFVLFALGLTRLDETAWIGFRAVPEALFYQMITFVLFWPVFLALELSQR